jgi:hypothetical protein
MYNPKQRMLNAYKGIKSDRLPVAPEFWYYYPAKVLGVSMIEFEREIPFWQSLKTTFEKYDCEGWGIAFPEIQNPNLTRKVNLEKVAETQYLETTIYNHKGNEFISTKMFGIVEPSWQKRHIADNIEDLPKVIDMLLDMDNDFNYDEVIKAHSGVGESYLLEMWTNVPFFDFIAEAIGFENAIMYFMDEDENVLLAYRERYTEYQKEFVGKIAKNTPFESFMIGCSYSCNSLIGQNMWRQWDKPYLQAMTDEIHKHGKLLHIHFHGRSIETVEDFAEIGIDCVCPFERGPGGNINNLEDLKYVRKKLQDKVTFNGNVHTVETLIRGASEKVRNEVRQIKQAFEGSNRLIIGSGDQVGRETPEENILAMIEEAKA